MIDFLQKSPTINREYYASELRQIKKKRKKLSDNVPVHIVGVESDRATKICLWTLFT